MKTKIETATENNTQKVTKRSLIVIICIVLVSITLNAQNIDNLNFKSLSHNEITFALSEENSNSWVSNTGLIETLATSGLEESKSIEELMSVTHYLNFYELLIPENENPMKLENWMTVESYFNTGIRNLEPAIEEELKVEDWMTNDNYFSGTFFGYEQAKENKLEIENWMLNDELFTSNHKSERPLAIENWMISEQVWK